MRLFPRGCLVSLNPQSLSKREGTDPFSSFIVCVCRTQVDQRTSKPVAHLRAVSCGVASRDVPSRGSRIVPSRGLASRLAHAVTKVVAENTMKHDQRPVTARARDKDVTKVAVVFRSFPSLALCFSLSNPLSPFALISPHSTFALIDTLSLSHCILQASTTRPAVPASTKAGVTHITKKVADCSSAHTQDPPACLVPYFLKPASIGWSCELRGRRESESQHWAH